MKIIFFANTSWNIYNYRLDLVKHFQNTGHDVITVSPQDRFTSIIKTKDISWSDISLSQHGMNPIEDLKTLQEIFELYKKEKPDIVSHFTIKCVLYGSIAAKLVGTKRVINNITGLGFLFSDSRGFIRIVCFIVLLMYRFVLKGTQVVFQNPNDMEYFIRKKIVKSDQTVLISGSGVTPPQQISSSKQHDEEIKVILPSRMIWSKGIQVFVDAAKVIVKDYPNIRFILVGAIPDHDRTKIPIETMEKWLKNRWIEWWGWKDDMAEIYHQADIICLPTLYGEGVPKTLIEGAAYQCALIATDIAGCRAIVHDCINGILVPKNDVQALVDAILQLVKDPALRVAMGKRGLEIVKNHFTTQSIVNRSVKIYMQS